MTRVDVLLSWRHTSSELPPDEEGLNVLVHDPGLGEAWPHPARWVRQWTHRDVWWARVPLPSE